MTRGSAETKAKAKTTPAAPEAAGDRVLWLLLPGGHPVRASARGAEVARATAWCIDGDGTRGLPWRPIDELGTKEKESGSP